jgi:hypothetical protein
MKRFQTILCAGLLVSAPVALAEEFSNTPKHETLQQAIAFERHKIAAAEAQAKKDAAEAAKASQPQQSQTAKAKRATRKTGQADRASKQ